MDIFSYILGRNSAGSKGALVPQVVTELPTTGESGILYLVPRQVSETNNVFDEYIWVNNDWELIGTAQIDISSKEDKSNKVTSLNSSSTDVQYPSAKCVYDIVDGIEDEIGETSTTQTSGTNLSIDNTIEALMQMTISGNTYQDEGATSANPQTIDTVTGNNTISVTGKSLWGGFSYTRNPSGVTHVYNPDGTFTVDGTSTANSDSLLVAGAISENMYISLPAGTYTISGGTAKVQLQVISLDSTSLASTTTSQFEDTFTIEATTDIFVRTHVAKNVSVLNETIYAMLERSSRATTYDSYKLQTYPINLGTMELCEIENYKDTFVKSGSDWIIPSKILKIASYNGETISTPYISTTGGLDVGATVYYVGSTNLTITDTTLISQLNVLKDAYSCMDITTIKQTNANLPFKLNVSTVNNNVNGRIEANKRAINNDNGKIGDISSVLSELVIVSGGE